MARIDNINNFLTDVADSIRTKTGKSGKISASSFDTEIASITTSEDLDNELATYNTELTEQEESLSGIVEYLENKIESGEPLLLQDKSIEITENGTTTITADEGYEGLNSVEVITNVASSGGEEPPALGMVLSKNNTEGFPTKLDIYGAMFFPASSFAGTTNILSKHLEEIDIHDYGVEVSQYCFRYNTALKRVNAPAGGLLVGTYLFDGCTALESVTMLERGTIYNYMFNNCTSLKEVNIASSKMTAINDYAFSGCSALETLDIPNGVKTLKSYAFNKCTSLKIKTIPDSVTELYPGAFYQCTSLIQLSANGVTKLYGDNSAQGCFAACSNLKAVWLNSAHSMGMFVFYGCLNLKRIFVNKPRADLGGYYNYFWSNNTVPADCQIICNDDEGFITKEEFDAIDWETYPNPMADYQQVEYLKSQSYVVDGTWINTGIYPTNKTSVEMEYNFYQHKNRWCNLFGSSRLFLIQCVAEYDTRLIGVWNNIVSSGSNIGGNYDYTKHIVKQDYNKIYFDGELKCTYTDGEFVDTNVLRLFSGEGQDQNTIQVYYCKIWEDGTLVRDYVPCYRKSDNVPGLFDKVENKFYENQGTVAFTAGADVAETE